MPQTRRRFKQTTTLHERLAMFAQEMRDKASSLPAGAQKQELLQKVRQADAASRLDDLISNQEPASK